MKEKNQQNKQNKKFAKGFTLLELLVVVIIIGILASIALPQYQKAVAKAELAQIVSITKTVKQAQERYFLANSKYAKSIGNLDVSTPTKNQLSISCYVGDTDGGYISCYNKKFALWSYMTTKYTQCAAKTNDAKSPLVNACKELIKGSCDSNPSVATCNNLGLDPCYTCNINKHVF